MEEAVHGEDGRRRVREEASDSGKEGRSRGGRDRIERKGNGARWWGAFVCVWCFAVFKIFITVRLGSGINQYLAG